LKTNKFEDAYWACYRFIRDRIFEPVWFRFFGHKFHIVKTKLRPAPWYDTDHRMLYAVMALIEWFVENDMQKITREELEAELVRIKEEDSVEYQKGYIEEWMGQWASNQEIISIYDWWKDYPRREEEIDQAITVWHDFVQECIDKNDKMNDFLGFMNNRNKLTKEDSNKENELANIHRKLERELLEDEQKYLIKAIKCRGRLWS